MHCLSPCQVKASTFLSWTTSGSLVWSLCRSAITCVCCFGRNTNYPLWYPFEGTSEDNESRYRFRLKFNWVCKGRVTAARSRITCDRAGVYYARQLFYRDSFEHADLTTRFRGMFRWIWQLTYNHTMFSITYDADESSCIFLNSSCPLLLSVRIFSVDSRHLWWIRRCLLLLLFE